jgi:predicted transcriptional regulator
MNARTYTLSDYERRARAGMTQAQAAKDMGVSKSAVNNMARTYGIKFPRPSDRYVKLRDEGMSNSEIARACGVKPSAVTAYFKKNGIERNQRKPRSKHERTLRAAQKLGMSYREVADYLGLKSGYVKLVCKRIGIELADRRSGGK